MKKLFFSFYLFFFYACTSVSYVLRIEEEGYKVNKTNIILTESNNPFDCCGCGPELSLRYTKGNVIREYGMNLLMNCEDCDEKQFHVFETIKKDKYTSITYCKKVVFETKPTDNLQEKWQSLTITKNAIKPLDSIDSLMFFQLLPKSKIYQKVKKDCNLGQVVGLKNIDSTIMVKKK